MRIFAKKGNQIVIILRGAPSSGKSTIAYLLSKNLPNTYKFGIDSMVQTIISPGKVDMNEWLKARPLDHELSEIIVKYLLDKGNNLAIEEIFLEAKEIDKFVKIAHKIGARVFVFELKVSLEEALRREKIRPYAEEGKPVKEAIELLDKNPYKNAIKIDTSKLTKAEILEFILQKIKE